MPSFSCRDVDALLEAKVLNLEDRGSTPLSDKSSIYPEYIRVYTIPCPLFGIYTFNMSTFGGPIQFYQYADYTNYTAYTDYTIAKGKEAEKQNPSVADPKNQ